MARFNQPTGELSTTYRAWDETSQTETAAIRAALMDRVVDLMVQKTLAREFWPELYDRGRRVLEGLPLATDEFGLALQRLQNALEYSSHEDFGAAAYELRLVRGQLSV